MKLWLYRPSTEPSEKSPVDVELANLPSGTLGPVKWALKTIRDPIGIVPGACPSRGRVRCVEVHTERYAYVFYARLEAQARVVVLYVTASGTPGPPDEGYAIAQSRLDDIPL